MFKRIPLTQGQFAIVDDADYEWLSKFKWFAIKTNQIFYAARKSKRINGKQYKISMAREILGLKRGDKRQADHIDHDTMNNHRLNLRAVTHQQNTFNKKNPKGYSWNKNIKRYVGAIGLNYKTIYLGCFRTADEAHNAYLRAKRRYHQICQQQ